MTWKNTDPRKDINKRANIVILRPDLNGRLEDASAAQVETKNAYCIFTNYEGHSLVNEDEKWDPIWWWTFAPERTV